MTYLQGIKDFLNGAWRFLERAAVPYSSGRYSYVVFDKQKLPVEGDTITVGNLVAEFKKISK